MKRLAILGLGLAAWMGAAVLEAQSATARSQVAAAQAMTISAEIVSIDAATRKVTLKGPLGGLTSAIVSDAVKDIAKYEVGDLVSVSYYEAVAASVKRQGDPQPLFSASTAATTAEPGATARAASASSTALTLVSMDLATNSIVLQGADGTIYPITVERPEFQAKLKDLKVGDVIDLTYSEALVTALTPLAAGEVAKVTIKAGTLVVDNGEVVKRMQNTLLIRNDRGRMLKVTVPGDFTFKIDGKDSTVFDLREGTKLHRTALRVSEVSYSD